MFFPIDKPGQRQTMNRLPCILTYALIASISIASPIKLMFLSTNSALFLCVTGYLWLKHIDLCSNWINMYLTFPKLALLHIHYNVQIV